MSRSVLHLKDEATGPTESGGVGRSKIDRGEWPSIISRREAGEAIAAIARDYNVTPSAISYILKKAHADPTVPGSAASKRGGDSSTTANGGARHADDPGDAQAPATHPAQAAAPAGKADQADEAVAPVAGTERRSGAARETGQRSSVRTLTMNRDTASGKSAAAGREAQTASAATSGHEAGGTSERRTLTANASAQNAAASRSGSSRQTSPAAESDSRSPTAAEAAGTDQPSTPQPSAREPAAANDEVTSELGRRLTDAAVACARGWDDGMTGDELAAAAHEVRRALAAIEIADSKRSSRKTSPPPREPAADPLPPAPAVEAPPVGQREPGQEIAPDGYSLGTVKFYKPSKGFGFVVPDDGAGDIYLAAEVVEAAGLEDLQTGDRVAIERGPGRKGEEVKSLQLLAA